MLSLDEEVRLYTTNAEREKYSLLATLFGIIVALDYLERAYVRDAITAVEIKVGVPATVEHSSEAGPETGKWIAETTQVATRLAEFHNFYGCVEASTSGQRPAASYSPGAHHGLCAIQGQQRLGWKKSNGGMVGIPLLAPVDHLGDITCLRLITLNGMKASEELTEEQSRQVCLRCVDFSVIW
ncbi:hypothetical protein ID866_4395 [Astraeus odoratus]|nr:hypothetical protein ID866_4395 [Astraeus odoratus]